MHGRRVIRAGVSAIFVMLWQMASPLADGQTAKGTILGTITDSSQAVVPAAKVTLTETNTNARRMETTNESGYYVFANLDPGTYEVQVEQTGFHRIIRGGVDLLPN